MENLIVIRTQPELLKLVDLVKEGDIISFDTETTGLKASDSIIGVSVSMDVETGYYVILRQWNKELQVLEELETLQTMPLLLEALKGKRLVMHNGIFDCKMVESNFKIRLIDHLHTDTMELAHLLDENRSVGLKELAFSIFGEASTKEQEEMKASIVANGGSCTKVKYELYKADAELIARYGAKDAILTLKLFYILVPGLFDKKLEKFFYDEESMPLMRGPTYHLNTTGLKVDVNKLKALKQELIDNCDQLKAEIMNEIEPYVKEAYPGTNKKNGFNIGSNQQLAWLLFIRLGNDFKKLTKKGREVAKELIGKVPYNPSGKMAFMKALKEEGLKPEKYLQADAKALMNYAAKYKWVEKLLEYNRLDKMLTGFVINIEEKAEYGCINPSFLQHGTTSGRYASRAPNFQNLPRDDKRIKSCIVSRPGKVFVASDQSQLEPRIFASFSQDFPLLKCFETGEDFYSVIGIPVFNKFGCSANKKDENYFGKKHENLRNIAKKIALSATYGTTAFKLSDELRDEEGRNLTPPECQAIIDGYFDHYPNVQKFMLESHETVKNHGVVYNLFGRPRNIPEAQQIKMYKNVPHAELPYQLRTFLNLSVNHRIQSTAASIMNRSAIKFLELCAAEKLDVKLVLQVHDELVVECPEDIATRVSVLLKQAMETSVVLPGVKLVTEPKIARNLADLK